MNARVGVASAVGVAVGVALASYAVMSLREQKRKRKLPGRTENQIRTKGNSSAATRSEETRRLLKGCDASRKFEIKFVEKQPMTADTKLFRFKLPDSEEVLGCPIGKNVFLSAQVNDKLETRPYVPTNNAGEKGFTEFVIKIYSPTTEFPQGGVFTRFLDSLKSEDTVSIHGPAGVLEYNGCGQITSENGPKTHKSYKCLAMVAGGTGITPMYQIIRAILSNSMDKTKIVLLYASKDEQNIILKKELDVLQAAHREQLKVYYVVEKASKESKLLKGLITEEMIKEKLPPATKDVAALLCGPTEMINFVSVPAIDSLGYAPENTPVIAHVMLHIEWLLASVTHDALVSVGGALFTVLRFAFVFVLFFISLFVLQSAVAVIDFVCRMNASQGGGIWTRTPSPNSGVISAIGHQCTIRKVAILGRFRKATKVFVTGSFVQWNLLLEMRQISSSVWTIQLQLPHGHQELRFIVDGYWRLEESYRVGADQNGVIHNVLHVSD